MSKRREVDPDEHALWEAVARTVKPARGKVKPKSAVPLPPKRETAKPVARPVHHAKPPKPPPEPLKGLVPVSPGEPMRGVDGATAERLRRGRIAPNATLDLHGMTQDRAYATLLGFIRRHHEQGARCLLVITGKGSTKAAATSDKGFTMPARSRAGVLRTLVPHWLNDSDVRRMVVGVQSAHQRHGGSGALYIYLRRKRER